MKIKFEGLFDSLIKSEVRLVVKKLISKQPILSLEIKSVIALDIRLYLFKLSYTFSTCFVSDSTCRL